MSTTIIPGPNVFTARSGSLFSTAANWSKGFVPSSSDAAVINDNCTIDISRTLGSLIVNAPFTASVNGGLILNVSQSFLVRGYVSMSSAAATTVFLFGKYNEIAGIAPGVSTFGYRGSTDQLLPGGPYYNLETSWYNGVNVIASTKKATGNLIVSGNVGINYGTIDLGRYDYYCSGSTGMAAGLGATLIKSQTGSVIFNGLLRNGSLGFPNYFVNFSNGNPTVEVRNGIDLYRYNTLNTGRGTWRFTTNNQSIRNTAAGTVAITFDGPVSIENVALSVISDVNGNAIVNLNDIINGTTSTSQLLNSGSIYFNSVKSLDSMTTGTFNYTSSNNTIGFTGDYSATIPSRFTEFRNVLISGTGTKTLGVNTYVSGTLTVTATAVTSVLDLGSRDLIVSGATYVSSVIGQIKKSGPGRIRFIGPLTYNGSSFPATFIDFSGGNPTVELNSGIVTVNTYAFNSGTGSWLFLSSSQKIETDANGASTLNFDCPIVIGSAVTLSIDSYGPINRNRQSVVLRNVSGINGTDATSTLINYGTIQLDVNATLMSVGNFTASFATASTITYNFTGSFPLPYTTYANVNISTGSRTLSGNTTILGNLGFGAGAEVDFGSNNVFISGSTNVYGLTDPSKFTLKKTGPGTITFNGPLNLGGSGPVQYLVDFSAGNPNLEFRSGITGSNMGGSLMMRMGTGSYNFTTNNQVIYNVGGTGYFSLSGSLIIGPGIELSLKGDGLGLTTLDVLGSINGTDANSKFRIGQVVTGVPNIFYNSPIRPMITGIFDVSSSANTFIYNTGSQDVRGGVYRNLTFLNGLKTLQGNVSVLGTFSTGSGATSGSYNLNGFTLTNP